ncbi:MAG TPA: D-tyrosyl-tRNA(Tyr) deacylase [Candidatus Limihabitans stercoravium]|nr:D-tyrosyl-tRNA(Tyr) deacylase [Candidatus Limihabitans stercoravium]
MKAVIQRVKSAVLEVDGSVVSSIGHGMVVYWGVEKGDVQDSSAYLARKIANMRIFSDENGKMNLSVKDVGGEILLVSQFTLMADTSRGNRPGFELAERPDIAKQMYLDAGKLLENEGVPVRYGVFGADMTITQVNDGPVTILMEKK